MGFPGVPNFQLIQTKAADHAGLDPIHRLSSLGLSEKKHKEKTPPEKSDAVALLILLQITRYHLQCISKISYSYLKILLDTMSSPERLGITWGSSTCRRKWLYILDSWGQVSKHMISYVPVSFEREVPGL